MGLSELKPKCGESYVLLEAPGKNPFFACFSIWWLLAFPGDGYITPVSGASIFKFLLFHVYLDIPFSSAKCL